MTALEVSAQREASLSVRKFFSLLRLRLMTQGLKPTMMWMGNVFNRKLLDQPPRGQCEVTPQLFVGPQFRQRGWRHIQDWGITAVVNLRREFDDLSLGVQIPHYLRLLVSDDDPVPADDLQRGVEFIHRQIENGGKVYVHCGAGVGRAPTMAAAYLVSRGDTPQQALDRIRQARTFIRPTRAQREELLRYYQQLTRDTQVEQS